MCLVQGPALRAHDGRRRLAAFSVVRARRHRDHRIVERRCNGCTGRSATGPTAVRADRGFLEVRARALRADPTLDFRRSRREVELRGRWAGARGNRADSDARFVGHLLLGLSAWRLFFWRPIVRKPLATLATEPELPGIVVPTAPAFHELRGTLPGPGSQALTCTPKVEDGKIPDPAVGPPYHHGRTLRSSQVTSRATRWASPKPR
jgi:hypothetical protein